jgi:hypothetical protein
MKRGFCSADRTKVEPSPRRRLKSGAGSPAGVVGGDSVVTAGLAVVATVVLVETGVVAEVVVASPVVAAGVPPHAATSVKASAAAVLRMVPSVRKSAA